MWTFGHDVREIERSHQHVVVEETATTGISVVFGALGLFEILVLRDIVGLVLALLPAGFGMWAAVSSLFVADRNRRVLVVRRRIGPWRIERVYEAHSVERIYVRSTIKGDGLAVRFKTGRTKDLTMSLNSRTRLDGAAAALNHFLPTSRAT